MAFIKSCSIDSRNEQSPTCEVVHETNKAYFRNLLPNRFLPSSVGKALAWRSGGPGFNPYWGQFLTKFFCSSLYKDLSDNLTETPIVKNSNNVYVNWFHTGFVKIFSCQPLACEVRRYQRWRCILGMSKTVYCFGQMTSVTDDPLMGLTSILV